jgi:hypothetical protein
MCYKNYETEIATNVDITFAKIYPISKLSIEIRSSRYSIKYVPRCLLSGVYRSSSATNHFIMF